MEIIPKSNDGRSVILRRFFIDGRSVISMEEVLY